MNCEIVGRLIVVVFFAALRDLSQAKGRMPSCYIIIDNFLLLIFVYHSVFGKQLKQIQPVFGV